MSNQPLNPPPPSSKATGRRSATIIRLERRPRISTRLPRPRATSAYLASTARLRELVNSPSALPLPDLHKRQQDPPDQLPPIEMANYDEPIDWGSLDDAS